MWHLWKNWSVLGLLCLVLFFFWHQSFSLYCLHSRCLQTKWCCPTVLCECLPNSTKCVCWCQDRVLWKKSLTSILSKKKKRQIWFLQSPLDVDLKSVHALFIQHIFVHVLLSYQYLIFVLFVPFACLAILVTTYNRCPAFIVCHEKLVKVCSFSDVDFVINPSKYVDFWKPRFFYFLLFPWISLWFILS